MKKFILEILCLLLCLIALSLVLQYVLGKWDDLLIHTTFAFVTGMVFLTGVEKVSERNVQK